MILYPMPVPPFLRINLHAVELHGKVNVIASRHSGHAALAHYLAPLHHVAFMHIDMAQMTVDCLQPVAMIDDDAVAIDAERSRIDHPAIIGCFDADVLGDREIVAEMNLLIDLLSLIDIVPHVGKRCFSLRMRLPGKRLRKQKPVSGLEPKIGQRLVVGVAHLVIDLYETSHKLARAVWIKLADHLLHEDVAHLHVVNRVLRLLLLRESDCDRAGHVIPRSVAGEDLRNRVGGHIPCECEERKQSRLAARHGPGAKCLIAHAHTRGGPTTRDIEGRQIGHAEIEIVLFRVDTHSRRLRHDRDITFQVGCLTEQVVRGSLNDQFRFAVSKLRRGLDAGHEVPCAVGRR